MSEDKKLNMPQSLLLLLLIIGMVAIVPLCSQVPIMTPIAMSRHRVGTTTRIAS